MRAFTLERQRENRQWKKVREFVLERDDHECQFPRDWIELWAPPCSGQLDPHHVVLKSRDGTLRNDPDNLKTLCRSHHDWVHAHPAASTQMGLMASPSPQNPQRREKT